MNNVASLNGVLTYGFTSRKELIDFALIHKKSLIAVNAEKILHATEQTKLLINQNIGYADGVGAVWALRIKGYKSAIKIPGCELWLDIIEELHHEKSFYLVGAREEIIQQVVQKLKNDFPSINIKGYRNGYIKTEEERNALIKEIAEKKPDVVFVAMGSPKQELLMQDMLAEHKAIYQGLGGSFDVYTGNVERAPEWWIQYNLEWAYRLLKQPKRIKRDIHLFGFFFRILFYKI